MKKLLFVSLFMPLCSFAQKTSPLYVRVNTSDIRQRTFYFLNNKLSIMLNVKVDWVLFGEKISNLALLYESPLEKGRQWSASVHPANDLKRYHPITTAALLDSIKTRDYNNFIRGKELHLLIIDKNAKRFEEYLVKYVDPALFDSIHHFPKGAPD